MRKLGAFCANHLVTLVMTRSAFTL